MSKVSDAVARVTQYVEVRGQMDGLHPDEVHSCWASHHDGPSTLTLSDLRVLLAALTEAQRPRHAHPVPRDARCEADLAAAREHDAAVEAHAVRIFEERNPGKRYADQPWDVQMDFVHSAQIILAP